MPQSAALMISILVTDQFPKLEGIRSAKGKTRVQTSNPFMKLLKAPHIIHFTDTTPISHVCSW